MYGLVKLTLSALSVNYTIGLFTEVSFKDQKETLQISWWWWWCDKAWDIL